MATKNSIKLFQDKIVRSIWDDEKEEWFFSVNDVVQILTDSTNVTDYIKKMRKRDEELSEGWGQIVTPLYVQTAGRKQKTNFANAEGLFRIIQSIPSKKAEPFKQWLAELSTTSITKAKNPQSFEENVQCAHEGGTVAAVARHELESKTEKSIVTPLNARDFFEMQIEAKKEQLYLPIRNFILGTGLSFGFSNEKLRIPFRDSYFIIDQLYYHIPSRRNILLKICRKNLSLSEKQIFIEQIQFFDEKNKREDENNAIGLLFLINENTVKIEYVIPDRINENIEELGLPSPDVFDSYLQKNLTDLRMN